MAHELSELSIGGVLPLRRVERLARAAIEDHACTDFGAVYQSVAEAVKDFLLSQGEALTLCAETRSGRMDTLECAVKEMGLHGVMFSSGGEYGPSYRLVGGDRDEECFAGDPDGQAILPIDILKKALDGDDAGLRARLERLLHAYEVPEVPPLVVIPD